MTVTPFHNHALTNDNVAIKMSEQEIALKDLLVSLCKTTRQLGETFNLEELKELSDTLGEMQRQVQRTPEFSMEGIVLRQRCNQLLESAACALIETARASNPIADNLGR